MIDRVSFVCQAGRLEQQSVLLAASLRLHFPSELQLIAAYPSQQGALEPATNQALQELGVEVVEIDNPLNPDYLIGHKVAALSLLKGSGLGLFLDSDMIAMRGPDSLSIELAAVPASVQHCNLSIWQYIYHQFEVAFPNEAPATLLSEEVTAPYYNTGLIAIPGDIAVTFADIWTDCALHIDADPFIPGAAKRPYLDQTSFPVVGALCGYPIKTLDENWNFRGWGWQIPADSNAIFYHYQDMARLSRQANSLAAARAAKSFSPRVKEVLFDQHNF